MKKRRPRFFRDSIRRPAQSEKGFTLIETAISLVIMMVVCLGAASLFAYATSANADANERELAMALAQKRIEWLRSIPFTVTTRNLAFAYPSGGLGATATNGVSETVTSAGRSYIVTTKIEDLSFVPAGQPDAGAPTIKRFTVTVSPGDPQSLGAVTLTAERNTLVTGTY